MISFKNDEFKNTFIIYAIVICKCIYLFIVTVFFIIFCNFSLIMCVCLKTLITIMIYLCYYVNVTLIYLNLKIFYYIKNSD